MNNPSRSRIFAITFFGFLCFGVVVARLFYIQVVLHDDWSNRGIIQHIRKEMIERERGTIRDRRGREIAVSIPVRSLCANPREISDPAGAARILAPVLNLPEEDLFEKLSRENRAFVWISRKLSNPVADAVEDLEIKGLHFVQEYKRFYPQLQMASHVVGFVGLDNKGLEGAELQFDEILKGPPVALEYERDAAGNPLPDGEIIIPHFYGNDVYLTIDMGIQAVVEEELAGTVAQFHAQSGTVVVMDPNTGEILAMASSPNYNPNNFAAADASLRRNRAVTDVYEPGSTFKIFTASALLDYGLVSPATRFNDPGRYRVYDHTIHNHTNRANGELTFAQIVEKSSNVGIAVASERMSSRDFYEALRNFGFGERTGVELVGEASGILRPVSEWSGLSRAVISIGQEVGVTPIQLAGAAGAVANGGLLMRPQIVRRICDSDGNLVRSFESEVRRRVIREETSRTMRQILQGVVERGTGTQAQVPGFTVAGKTGTAQRAQGGGYLERSYNSGFIGWLPADDPVILIVVMIREPDPAIGYYGGTVAAPLFGRIASRTMSYLRVYPTGGQISSAQTPPVDQVFDQTRIEEIAGEVGDTYVVVPTLVGKSMREVYEKVFHFPLDLHVEGSGVAVQQSPPPGAVVAPGSGLRVVFSQRQE